MVAGLTVLKNQMTSSPVASRRALYCFLLLLAFVSTDAVAQPSGMRSLDEENHGAEQGHLVPVHSSSLVSISAEDGGKSRPFLRFGRSSEEVEFLNELLEDEIDHRYRVKQQEKRADENIEKGGTRLQTISRFLTRPTKKSPLQNEENSNSLFRPLRSGQNHKSYRRRMDAMNNFMVRPVKKSGGTANNNDWVVNHFLNRPTRSGLDNFWVRPTRSRTSRDFLIRHTRKDEYLKERALRSAAWSGFLTRPTKRRA